MIGGILGAETAFWIVLVVALATRYLLRLRRASTVLLLGLPAIDLALLALVTMDVARGAEPTQSHAIAASYLGFTIAFGHSVVRWADRWFAYRFDGAPRPQKPPKGSADYVRALWIEWFRVVLAAVLATAILASLAIFLRGQEVPTSIEAAAQDPFWAQPVTLAMVVVVWFLAGPAFARRTRN